MSSSSQWKKVRLGDVLRLINGRAYKKAEHLDSGTPVIRIQNLNGGNRWFYSDLSLPDDKYCEGGDLLFAWSASFGPYIWSGEKSIYHYHIWKVEVGDDLDKAFAFRLLEHLTQKIKDSGRGISMIHVTKSGMEAWEISLPPLAEQKRIAGILDQADTLRRQRQRTLDHLGQLGQSIFYEMFGEWTDISDKWDIVSLGDQLDFLTSGSRGWAKYYSDVGAKFIRIQNVKDGVFDDSDLAHVEAPNSAEAKRTAVEPGDVLMSITADLGRAAVVPETLGPAHINQHLAILRSKAFNPYFLTHAITSPFSQRNIERKNNGGVKSGLNFTDIRTLKIIFPPKPIQDEFAKKLKLSDGFQNQFQKSIKSTNSLFASLQQRAFLGEL